MSIDIYTIYKITNLINGKCYIGYTSLNPPEKRWKSHIRRTLNPSATKRRYYLHKSMKKYGIKNFTFEIICQSTEQYYAENTLEPYFIKKYNSHGKNGYNLTDGGHSINGYIFTEEDIKKISINTKIGQSSLEVREKLKRNHQNRLKDPEYRKLLSEYAHRNLGVSKKDSSKMGKRGWTKEQREELRRKRIKYHYIIICKTGEVKEYDSLKLFAKEHNLKYWICSNAIIHNNGITSCGSYKISRVLISEYLANVHT